MVRVQRAYSAGAGHRFRCRTGHRPGAVDAYRFTPNSRDSVRHIHVDHAHFGDRYAANGIYGLIKLNRLRDEYEETVLGLAQRIVRVAHESPLPSSRPRPYETHAERVQTARRGPPAHPSDRGRTHPAQHPRAPRRPPVRRGRPGLEPVPLGVDPAAARARRGTDPVARLPDHRVLLRRRGHRRGPGDWRRTTPRRRRRATPASCSSTAGRSPTRNGGAGSRRSTRTPAPGSARSSPGTGPTSSATARRAGSWRRSWSGPCR